MRSIAVSSSVVVQDLVKRKRRKVQQAKVKKTMMMRMWTKVTIMMTSFDVKEVLKMMNKNIIDIAY